MAELSKLAVLIDADNTQPSITEPLLAEIAKFGVASVKRIYGDWTQPQLKGWKEMLVQYAIQPMQQFGYTVGKNATDSAMIIDAMDLLYTGRFDGFCLVSSDSDFTRLASRLREAGLTVYGFGERKTPQALRAACDKFIYLDVLRGASRPAKAMEAEAAKAKPAQAKTGRKPAKQAAPVVVPEAEVRKPEAKPDPRTDAELLRLFQEAVDDAADDDGWAGLGAVGNLIAKRRPDFDSRNYGYRKLSDLAIAIGAFETDERKTQDGKQKTLYLRDRNRRASAVVPAERA